MAKTQEIKLPQPKTKGEISLEESIARRRSVRSFIRKDLSLEQIGQILWAAQGITDAKTGHRASPSAGGLYPMEIYAVTKDGMYHYVCQGHLLEVLTHKDLRPGLSGAALRQGSVKEAALDVVICAVYDRVTLRYGERGKMYVDIEAGHIAQNIHLQAVALGLDSVPIGAFDEGSVKSVLDLPDGQVPLYIIPVGYAKN